MKKTKIDRILSLLCAFALVFALVSCGGEKDKESESASESEHESDSESVSEEPTEEERAPKKRVAFTFDDGPHPTYTKQIVDCARSHGGRVTFFVVGYMLNRSQAHGNAFLYALESGCEVGLHSFTHQTNYDECDEETFLSELSRTLDAARSYAPDFETALMRPVGGRITAEFVKLCPYAVVKWNVDTRDWELHKGANEQEREAEVQAIVDEIVKSAKDGSIILMHDLYENTVVAFERAAEILASEGYEFVTVSELLGEELEAGKVFSKGKPIEATKTGKNQ